MGLTTKISNWTLNYQVAAFAAYATIFVESICLILGGFENASLLSISILTNSSAVFIAGLGGPSSTPLAILRICLTSLFLLCAIILRKNETFNGTYAILCSVAHLTYQSRFQHNGQDSETFLPQHEKGRNTDDAPSKSCLENPLTDHNDMAHFSRSLRIFFGEHFCLEGAIWPVTILGTVMTYRVFDFDLGFGLVFAFISAFLSSIILLFANYARMRDRRIDIQKALQQLVGLMIFTGTLCFIFFTNMEFPDIDTSWWRISFGVAWFLFLFKVTYAACRFLTHATFFSCAACSQREAGIHGPLTEEASTGCIWDNYVALPALNQEKDGTFGRSTTFRIRRQKGPDLVERFWFNDQEWFQISPRSFVIFFVSCLVLTSFSGGILNLEEIFPSIGSHVSKNTAFYITMAFTFVSTGHTSARNSPELMFVPLSHSFPDWKATARATIATMLVHAYLIFPAFSKAGLSFAISLACTITAPLLLAGISKRLDPTGQQGKCGPDPGKTTEGVSSDDATSSTTRWTIDSTMVYSSSRIKCLDLRVLLLGLSITCFDVLCNQYQDEMFINRWPTSAIISISVTAVWLYLESSVPRSQDVEPGLLLLAVTALVGIFSQLNLLSTSELYDDEWEDGSSTNIVHIPENGFQSKSVLIALWYTTLTSMVVANRLLVQRKAEQMLPVKNEQPPRKNHLLFAIHVEALGIDFAWQLRNSTVSTFLVFTMVASWCGESWPLEMNTTVAGLLLFALIIGFQLRPWCGSLDEKRSLPHVAALSFSVLLAILATILNSHGVFDEVISDPKSNWKAGFWAASIFYQIFVAIILQLEGRGWFTG